MIHLEKKDLEWAAQKGLITQDQINPLWTAFESRPDLSSKFNLINVIYYFGALLIIFGMGWFMNKAWDEVGASALFGLGITYVIGFTAIAYFLSYKKKLEIPGGLLATLAVCLVPLTIFGFQKMTGLWPQDYPGAYRNYHIWVKGSWFWMELGTILAGIIMLRFFKFTFLTAPIFFSLWYMSMDLTPLLFGKDEFSWDERKLVSVIFGSIILLISYLVDRRLKQDFAFWGYLFGMIAFWGGLSMMESNSELGKFIYFSINVIFIFLSLLFDRRIFIICGTLGCIGYLAHLAEKVFNDYLSFPVIISMLGLGIIGIGIKYQKNKEAIDKKVIDLIPKFILDLSPIKR